jgi:hypothetical protein
MAASDRQWNRGMHNMMVRKAIRLVKWIYTQPVINPRGEEGALSRTDLIAYGREFQNLSENPSHVRFWHKVAALADVNSPSQDTIDIVIDLLELIEDVKNK